jgi:hypothetical protein
MVDKGSMRDCKGFPQFKNWVWHPEIHSEFAESALEIALPRFQCHWVASLLAQGSECCFQNSALRPDSGLVFENFEVLSFAHSYQGVVVLDDRIGSWIKLHSAIRLFYGNND